MKVINFNWFLDSRLLFLSNNIINQNNKMLKKNHFLSFQKEILNKLKHQKELRYKDRIFLNKRQKSKLIIWKIELTENQYNQIP